VIAPAGQRAGQSRAREEADSPNPKRKRGDNPSREHKLADPIPPYKGGTKGGGRVRPTML